MHQFDDHILDLLEEWERLKAAGTPATPATPDELAKGDAAVAARLREAISLLHKADKMAAQQVPTTSIQKNAAGESSGYRGKNPLGPYELLQLLGKGGMGAVFKARHTRLNKFVALKVLPESMTRSLEALARFDREMRAVGALEHPNIVRAMDADEDEGTHYLVMEYVDGQDLQSVVRERGALSVSEACRLVRDAALALDYAHQAGLVHRDIKPSNLLLTSNNQLKILDLGLARLATDAEDDSGLTNTGVSLGTPDYMAPEQWGDSHSVDARTDLYALGCTLFFLLVGRPPYGIPLYRTVIGKMGAHAQGAIPPLREARAEAPPALDSLYQKLLAKKPEERIQTGREVAKELEPFCITSAEPPELGMGTEAVTPRVDAADLDATQAVTTAPNATIAARFPSPDVQSTSRPSYFSAVLAIVGVVVLLMIGAMILNRPESPALSRSTQTALSSDPAAVNSSEWTGWPDDAPKPAIAPFSAEQARKYQEEWAAHLQVPVEWENSIGIKFALIPPGEFMMGSTKDEIEAKLQIMASDDHYQREVAQSEAPQHRVILSQPFYLGIHEVTQKQYEAVMGVNPSHYAPTGKGKDKVTGLDIADHPVDSVGWDDAMEFCAKLGQKEKLKLAAGTAYRLPTEAQWEFACRGGTSTKFWTGDDEAGLTRAVQGFPTWEGRTYSVGALEANPFGLFDVHGNVWEWVQDWWEPGFYSQAKDQPAINPLCQISSSHRHINRGGSSGGSSLWCLSATRFTPAIGLRDFGNGFRLSCGVDTVRQAIKTGDIVKVLPAREKSSPTENVDLIAENGWLNVLPLIEPWTQMSAYYGHAGKWTKTGDGIVLETSDAWGSLVLPVHVKSDDYEVEFELTPLRPGKFHLDVAHPDGGASIGFGQPDIVQSLNIDFRENEKVQVNLRVQKRVRDLSITGGIKGQPAKHIDYDTFFPIAEVACFDNFTSGVAIDKGSSFAIHAIRMRPVQGTFLIRPPKGLLPTFPAWLKELPLPGLVPAPKSLAGQQRWQLYARKPIDCANAQWSPDGKWIAATSLSNLVRIYDAESMEIVNIVPCVRPASLAWSPGSSQLACGTVDGLLHVWSASSHETVSVRAHSSPIDSISWSRTGNRLATGGSYGDGRTIAWSPEGRMLWKQSTGDRVDGFAWSRDDASLLVGHANGTLIRLNAVTGEVEGEAPTATAPRLTSSASGALLAVRGPWHEDHKDRDYIQILNAKTLEKITAITSPIPLHSYNAAAFSPDEKLIAVASQDAWVRVWEIESGKLIRDFPLGTPGYHVSWSSDGKRVLFPCFYGNLAIGSVFDEKPIQYLGSTNYSNVSTSDNYLTCFSGGQSTPFIAGRKVKEFLPKHFEVTAWLPKSEILVCWPQDVTGVLLDVSQDKVVNEFIGHTASLNRLCVSSGGNRIATLSRDKSIRIWQPDGKCLRTIGEQEQATAIALSSTGDRIAIAFRDKSARIFEVEGDKELSWKTEHEHDIYTVHWAGRDHLVTGEHREGQLHRVKLWSLEKSNPECIKISPANTLLPGTSLEDSLVVQDTSEVRNLQGEKVCQLQSMPYKVAMQATGGSSGDERSLWGDDQILRTWNFKTGALQSLTVPLAPGKTVTLSPEGDILAQSPGVQEELVYGVEQANGSLKLFTPVEFQELSKRLSAAVTTTPATPQEDADGQPVDFADERKAAEWLAKIVQGESYVIVKTVQGEYVRISSENREVPPNDFVVDQISLVKCEVTDDDLANLNGCRSIQTCAFYHEPHLTAKGLRHLASNSELQMLTFAFTPGIDGTLTKLLPAWKELRVLGVGHCQIGYEHQIAWPAMPQLTSLSLNDMPLTKDGLRAIVRQCPNLESINVVKPNEDQNRWALPQLASLSHLRSVGCNVPQLTNEGIKTLKSLPHLTHLYVYSPLNDPAVSFENVAPLAESITDLQVIDFGVHGPGLSEADIATILKFKRLQSLWLLGPWEKGITDEQLQEIANFPDLRELKLDFDEPHRRYTKAGIDAFRQRRPDVNFTVDGTAYSAETK
jgi:serine/threonine protein kinase/WD40 repeat protein